MSVVEDSTTYRDGQPDGTELYPSESPTEHAYAWALDDGDAPTERYRWRPVWARAGAALAAAAVIAAVIVTVGLVHTGRSGARQPIPGPHQASSAPAAAPSLTIDASPPVQTEVPLDPQDAEYIRLLAAAGIRVTDFGALTTGARRVCGYISEGHAASDAANLAVKNNPLMTLWEATSYVQASIQVYCPQYLK